MWSLCSHEDKETLVLCTLYFEVALHHVHLFHSATKPLVVRRIAFHCTAKDQAVGASLVGRRIAMQSKALQSTCKEKSRQWMHLWWEEELQCNAMQSEEMQCNAKQSTATKLHLWWEKEGDRRTTASSLSLAFFVMLMMMMWWCIEKESTKIKEACLSYLFSVA